MKITETKVKTLYNIVLDTADFAILLEQFHDDKTNNAVILYSCNKAFDFIETTYAHYSEQRTLAIMGQMHSKANNDTYNYLARSLGFGGWENAGYFDKNRNRYYMTVYNNGDTLNE